MEVKAAFADAAREGTPPETIVFYVREKMEQDTADRVLGAVVSTVAGGMDVSTKYYRAYEAQWKPFYDDTGFQGYVGEPTVHDRGVTQKPYVTPGDIGGAMFNLGIMGFNVLSAGALRGGLGAATKARSAAQPVGGITQAEVREFEAGYQNAIRARYGTKMDRLESIAAKMPVDEASGQNLAVQLQNELDLSFGMQTSRHPAIAGSTLEGMEHLGSAHARRIAAEMYRARLDALQGRIGQLEASGYY
jgi:hypothetical protein